MRQRYGCELSHSIELGSLVLSWIGYTVPYKISVCFYVLPYMYMYPLCMQVAAYIKDRKEFLAHQERDVPSDMQRMRQLQRENSEVRWGAAADSAFSHEKRVANCTLE